MAGVYPQHCRTVIATTDPKFMDYRAFYDNIHHCDEPPTCASFAPSRQQNYRKTTSVEPVDLSLAGKIGRFFSMVGEDRRDEWNSTPGRWFKYPIGLRITANETWSNLGLHGQYEKETAIEFYDDEIYVAKTMKSAEGQVHRLKHIAVGERTETVTYWARNPLLGAITTEGDPNIALVLTKGAWEWLVTTGFGMPFRLREGREPDIPLEELAR